MKLAILGARGIPARYGGFETFAEQLSVRLAERGHEVTVFCEATEDGLEEYKGVKLSYVPARNIGPLTTIAYDAACLWYARSSFDVIYMLGYGSSALCWLPRLWGTEVWINMDGLEWARAKWSLLARCYFRWAEAIAMHTPSRMIADAAAIKANLQLRYRRLPLCDVIPYGCEIVRSARLEELNSFGLHPHSYYLVVCRFEPENHIREIIEGFLNSESEARLVLVGDHTRKSKYTESTTSCSNDRVLFVGPVYDESRIRALRYFCRGYLHGHSVGGTNPSLLEAMGCGNVIISHDNPFNREVLGDSGLFFATPRDISTAIDAVESGRADLEVMKLKVIERVKQYYAWDQIADYYGELLSLVGSRSGNRKEIIHCAPLLPDKAKLDVVNSSRP